MESVDVEGSSATIETSGLDRFAFTLHDTGVTTATVEGMFHPADPESCQFASEQDLGGGLPFSLQLEVEVHRPAGVTFHPESLLDVCNPREVCTHVLSGGQLFPRAPSNSLTLVNEDGAPFVVGTEDTEFGLLERERGLSSLYARGPDQVLQIESEWGKAGDIELVTPESIHDMHVYYALHGYGRAEIWLESGESIEGLWDDKSSPWLAASPRTWSGGHEICSIPQIDSFVFGSDSPEVCDLGEARCTTCDADLAASANLLGSGRCELRLSGPRFDDGKGLEHVWQVDFEQRQVE